MRTNPDYAIDTADLMRLVRENPWATLVSSTADGLLELPVRFLSVTAFGDHPS